MKRFENILVIKSGALGDLIAGTTALRALRDGMPGSRITLLTNALAKEVCPPGTLCDDLIIEPAKKSWNSTIRLVWELRTRKFDLAVNLRWASEGSALLALLSGAGTRAGSGPRSARWLYTVNAPYDEGRRHEFLRHCDIVASLGIPATNPRPYVHMSDPDRSFAKGFLEGAGGGKTIDFHPGASTSSKTWPPDRFIELGKRFVREFGANIIVTWGPGEEELAGGLAAAIGDRAKLAPPTTIGRLAAIIAGCAMCVCNYSGVMNVAMAVGTPLLALGCTSPEDWGPYGDAHRTVNAVAGEDSYTGEERAAAMKSISVESVWEALAPRWKELTSQSGVIIA